MRRARLTAAALLCVGAVASAPTGQAAPPAQQLTALSALPPGNSGFYPLTGQVQGTVTSDRAAFGEHTDDQREMYWANRFKPAGFSRSGTAVKPIDGLEIYRDAYGVPAVYGKDTRTTWYGAGWVAAQDRLFLMDGVRRSAEGRLAELTGPSAVPADVQARVLTYSDAEYQRMFDRLPAESRAVVKAYVDGVNAYIATVQSDPTKLPGEYALLTSQPEPFTIKDVVASGVFMTRYVAAEGGNEMSTVAALKALQAKYGVKGGRGVFKDLYWQEDAKAFTTVPAPARFDNSSTPKSQRSKAFDTMASYAAGLPADLANGNGTGAYAEPAEAGPTVAATLLGQVADSLDRWRASFHGGSYQYAIAGSRTKSHKPLLESAPQLGWTAPSYLYELEVHGGGYDARGVTVPGLPVVGIGFGKRVAWALTTGYSKTIDSFIETTRTVAGVPQYQHKGTWKPMSCRDETVSYRNAPQGVPLGPDYRTATVKVCRTVHGPVVATSADGTRARSVQYAMWDHEVDTINGVLQWNRAQDLKQFEAGMRQVTWNENTMYADADGHIAYWHPGRYPVRARGVDERFPTPGTGAYDWKGFRAWSAMPHSIDPKQGYLVNWNNKPAAGWSSGEAQARDDGYGNHARIIADQLAAGHSFSFANLPEIDKRIGSTDARWRDYKGPLLSALSTPTPAQKAALAVLKGWSGASYGPGAGTSAGTAPDKTTDGPAPTLFEAYVKALRSRLVGSLPAEITERKAKVSLHLYDVTAIDNLALRVLAPSRSSLRPSRDYTGGKGRAGVVRAAFDDAIAAVTKAYGASPSSWRRPHPTTEVCTLTEVIGPPCAIEPYEDRGSYIHLIGF